MNSVLLNGQSVMPSKIICIGRNYVEHISELGNEVPDEMVVFIKPNSAISENLISFLDEPLHYEGELCFMIQDGRFSAVGFGLDLTRRQLQSKLKSKGLPWERAKAFDGAAIFSEFIEFTGPVSDLSFNLCINGSEKQNGHPELMMYKPAEILFELKRFISLEEGDIVMTGTPKGVGEVNSGDEFQGCIRLNNQELVNQRWVAE